MRHAGRTESESPHLEKRRTDDELERCPTPRERRVTRKSTRSPNTSFKLASTEGSGEEGWCPIRLKVAVMEAGGGAGEQGEGRGGRHVTPTVTSATPPPRQSFLCSRRDCDRVIGSEVCSCGCFMAASLAARRALQSYRPASLAPERSLVSAENPRGSATRRTSPAGGANSSAVAGGGAGTPSPPNSSSSTSLVSLVSPGS